MHIWYLDNWENKFDLSGEGFRRGLRLRFDAEVDEQVRGFCVKFAKWLQREFFFPVRVSLYVKSDYRIKARDGDRVVGLFVWPLDNTSEPRVRIAAGDYEELKQRRGEKEAMWSILGTIAHELTHYFQYINDISLTKIGLERQATMYSDYILIAYNGYLENGERIKREKNLWRSCQWEEKIDLTKKNHRTGLRLRVESRVDGEVREACKKFVKFLRQEYFFPVRVVIYVKNTSEIVMENGSKVKSIFRKIQKDDGGEPHICIAAGNYADLCEKQGKDPVLSDIVKGIARQLTYYFQWVNDVHLTPIGEKRQAGRYAERIIDEFGEN